ncbi:type II toxin-antitoxin system antitoxin DNA ADP-ribosyl glycohydrolase DarG [Caulobacter sp. LjRoot300]|uniref:type II toxin-antitoxin system antitoxin DNA ADP-ribosyl glycohydrolase DarG n=1 Tax=Caulobacter sp. LjRoot300 TaxID=3342321 RepID=UPI003ECDCB66
MIEEGHGDVLRIDAEAIVNTVNCVGIMGRGIALQFKNAYPANFEAYAQACSLGEVEPGRMFVFETGYLTNPRYIINFPTKRHWKGKSRLSDIEVGLQDLRRIIVDKGIRSIAVPPLGAGLGGLDWADVKPKIVSALQGLADVRVIIFNPGGAPDPRVMARTQEIPKMSAGRAALVVLMHRYLGGLLDPFVSLLEVHKLMYFMQAAGQPLQLRFTKAQFGPYAENLRHVLRQVEGHLVTGYADGGDQPHKQLELVPGSVVDAEAFLASDSEARNRFDEVALLVNGFETPYGLELLATVHWVVTQEGATTVNEALDLIHHWNDRKKTFSREQVELAFSTLDRLGWTERTVAQH